METKEKKYKITEFGPKCVGNRFFPSDSLGIIYGVGEKYLESHKENAAKRGNEILIEEII